MKKKPFIWAAFLCGILSVVIFATYYYSANHPPYRYVDVIVWGPIASIVGFVLTMFTRKQRDQAPLLWFCSLVVNGIGFLICAFVLVVLVMIARAAFSGNFI